MILLHKNGMKDTCNIFTFYLRVAVAYCGKLDLENNNTRPEIFTKYKNVYLISTMQQK